MKPPERLLVRGVNWLGDAVMTMPALCRLREAYPNAYIAVLTFPKLADLYAYQPAVDAVLPLTREEPMLAVAARLRAERFDTGLILTNSLRTVLPFWLANIPRRVGFAGRGRTLLLTHPVRHTLENQRIRKRPRAEILRLATPLDSRDPSDTVFASQRLKPAFPSASSIASQHASPETSPPTSLLAASPGHHLYHYLRLAAALGANEAPLAPRLVVPEADVHSVRERFCLPAPEGRSLLFGLNPGAEYGLAKRWPEERFIQTAVELHRRFDCRWIVFGGQADRELAARITAEIQAAVDRSLPQGSAVSGSVRKREPDREEERQTGSRQMVWNLAGQTSLRELCAALHLCDLVLTNDTGPMHIAAAVGTRVVVPFGSTSPELTGPGLPGETRHRLLKATVACTPCFQRVCPIDFRCMQSITTQHIVAEVTSLLSSLSR